MTPQYSSASISLEVPTTNTGGGIIPLRKVGTIEPGKWAIVRAAGFINLATNPQNYSCNANYVAPGHGARFGPMGQPYSNYLKVNITRLGAGLQTFLDGDSSKVKTNVIYNPNLFADTIKASRNGISQNGCNGFGAYSMTGGQTVELSDLDDPKVRALTSMIAAGDSVTFTISNPPPGLNIIWMAFHAGDTLSTPKGYGGWTQLTACNLKSSCRTPIVASGRMYVMLGNTVGGVVHYPSNVVWVNKNTTAKLTLACSPTTVQPGDNTVCVAGTTPADSSVQIREWFVRTGSSGSVTVVCGVARSCTTPISETSTVHVLAKVAGYDQTKSVAINVLPSGVDCMLNSARINSGPSNVSSRMMSVVDCGDTTSAALTVEAGCSPNPVIRGAADVVCVATASDPSAKLEWRFHPTDTSLPPVVAGTPGPSWSGKVAASGVVSVFASNGSETADTFAAIQVSSRAWGAENGGEHPWGPTYWDVQEGNGCQHLSLLRRWEDAMDSISASLSSSGLTIANARCDNSFIYPDTTVDGFNITAATFSGPNAGYLYVTSPGFKLDVHTTIAPIYMPYGQKYPLVGAASDWCFNKLGVRPDSMNTYDFNTKCGNAADSARYANMLNQLWRHEGEHLRLAVDEGQKSQNNLMLLVEAVVSPSYAILRERVKTLKKNVNGAVYGRAKTIDMPELFPKTAFTFIRYSLDQVAWGSDNTTVQFWVVP